MNRYLVIPASCCVIAFAALLAAFHGAVGRETATGSTHVGERARRGDLGTMPSKLAYVASKSPQANGNLRLSIDEAQVLLTTLTGEYLRPWRQRENSPRHLYSRAAPRPIPSISAKTELASSATGQTDSFLVATITISTAARSQSVPCVVDRITKQVRLFNEGQWVTEDEWLTKAPLP